MFFFRESDAGWMNKDGRRVSCEVMWMFPVAVRRVEPVSLMETHYSSVCLTAERQTDHRQTGEKSSFLFFLCLRQRGNRRCLPLCRKVTARLIGINQLAAPVEWRRRDLKRNGIDPKREVYTAPGPRLYPFIFLCITLLFPTPPQKKKKEPL